MKFEFLKTRRRQEKRSSAPSIDLMEKSIDSLWEIERSYQNIRINSIQTILANAYRSLDGVAELSLSMPFEAGNFTSYHNHHRF